MLEILINDQRLDLPRQEVSITRQSMLFDGVSDAIWSTDLSIPNTARNRAILGLPDVVNNTDVVGQRLECDIILQGTSERGVLVVSGCTSYEVQACVLIAEPNEVLDVTLNEIAEDDASTIFPLGKMNTPGTLRFPRFGTTNFLATGTAYPVTYLSQIFARVNADYGYQVTTDLATFTTEAIMPSRFTVCPQNGWVCGLLHVKDNDIEQMYNGKQTAVEMEFEGEITEIEGDDVIVARVLTATRECSVNFAVGLFNIGLQSDVSLVKIANDGTVEVIATESPSLRTVEISETGIAMQEGDRLALYSEHWEDVYVVMQAFVSGYAINADDYGEELEYQDIDLKELWDKVTRTDLPDVIDSNSLSLTFFGQWCNLPKLTVRDLLFDLCLRYGGRLVMRSGGVEITSNSGVKHIEGVMTEAVATSSHFGARTYLNWHNGEEYLAKTFPNNGNLEAVKELAKTHINKMLNAFARIGGANRALARVPITEDGKYIKDDDGLNIGGVVNVSGYRFVGYGNDLHIYGIDNIKRVLCVTIETYDDVSRYDFVEYEGHRYLISEVETDCETIKSKVQGYILE